MELKPGYKQTELGVIPEEWEANSIGSVVSITTGAKNTQDRIDDGLYPFFVRSQTVERINSYSFDGEAVLTAGDGVGTGKIFHYINGKFDFHQRVYKMSEFGDQLEGFFFYLYFSNNFYTRIMQMTAKSSVDSVRREMIADMKIPLPPLPEQRAIATALSDVDSLIASLDKLVAKKRDMKQAAMQELLTGKRRLPGFSGEWDKVLVGQVITRYFSGPSPTCIERNILGEDEWGVLKTTAATIEQGWDWTKHKVLPKIYWDSSDLELQVGDVIVTKAGPRHRVGVTAWIDFVPKRLIPSGKMITLRPNQSKVVPFMLAAAITAKEAQLYLDQRTTGMAESQVNFENADLLNTPIIIPPFTEQTAITAILSDMNTEIAALEQKRDKTRLMKQRMMQELLTGRIRLI